MACCLPAHCRHHAMTGLVHQGFDSSQICPWKASFPHSCLSCHPLLGVVRLPEVLACGLPSPCALQTLGMQTLGMKASGCDC